MAVVTTNLGVITAYGDAVAAGYTGTKAEWQALMANYATVGQQAAQSAQTASTKASEASTSAESAQSAKTAAKTAQQKAETAQQKAETAAASITVDDTLSIAGKAADAKATGDVINNINNNLVNLVAIALITDSANGSVAHFVDGADSIPMKSLKVAIEPVQSGSGDPSPENARPISGWDSVKVTGHGRNFCKCIVKTIKQNKNGLTATPNGDGSITINGTCTGTLVLYFNLATEGGDGIGIGQGDGMKNLPNGTYRFGALPSGVRLQIYGSNVPNATSADAHFISDSTRGTFTIAGAYRYNWVRMSVSVDTVLDNATVYPALYLASDTDGTYEPYNGNTYDISLSSAGTVYGGTLDAVSGELTVDKAIKTFNGSESWYLSNGGMRCQTPMPADAKSNSADTALVGAMSNEFVEITPNRTWDGTSGAGFGIDTNRQLNVCQTGQKTMTVDSWKTWLASHNMQIVYPLATPVTYNLTPTEVKSLLGINNIWSDAGDVDVEYRADTKLYIKRLTDSDTDMIADSNIVSGQYFMVGNDLYKATVNIASGAQIVVGTNAAKVSLSEALNEINA